MTAALGYRAGTNIMLYPDSGKYGAWHGGPANPSDPANFRVFARRETAVDYWDGADED